MLKILQTLPTKYFGILQSYLKSRYLTITCNNETSSPIPMLSGVPRGSILGPPLYTLYTADIPQSPLTTLSTYADDKAVFSTHHNPDTASSNLQHHIQSIDQWTQKWRLKINVTKSKHIIFTLRRGHCPPVNFNKAAIPRAESIKYLGLHFDKQLNWKKHVTTTRKHLDLKSREINWLIGKHSPLSMPNTLLIYKTVLRPVWTYGIELWGLSNINIIQRYQSKMLRSITNAPWYVTNQSLYQDLRIPLVRTVYRERTAAHHATLRAHTNPLMETLLEPRSNRRPNGSGLLMKQTKDESRDSP